MDAVIPFNYTVVSASAEAESKRYKMLRDTQGRIWLVAEQGNPADNIYVSGGENSQGFGGRLITFQLNDEWPPGTRHNIQIERTHEKRVGCNEGCYLPGYGLGCRPVQSHSGVGPEICQRVWKFCLLLRAKPRRNNFWLRLSRT